MNNLFLIMLLCATSPAHKMGTVSQKLVIPVIRSFNGLTIYGNMDVFITEGEQNQVTITSEDVTHDIKLKVEDSVLVIRKKNGLFGHRDHARIIIMVKNIHSITVMDDAEVRTIGQLCCKNLKLKIMGDGAIYANTSALEVTTFIQGLGKIVVNGVFKNTTVNKDMYGNMVTTYK